MNCSKETHELLLEVFHFLTEGHILTGHWLYYISTVRDVDAHWWIQLSVTRTRRSLALRL